MKGRLHFRRIFRRGRWDYGVWEVWSWYDQCHTSSRTCTFKKLSHIARISEHTHTHATPIKHAHTHLSHSSHQSAGTASTANRADCDMASCMFADGNEKVCPLVWEEMDGRLFVNVLLNGELAFVWGFISFPLSHLISAVGPHVPSCGVPHFRRLSIPSLSLSQSGENIHGLSLLTSFSLISLLSSLSSLSHLSFSAALSKPLAEIPIGEVLVNLMRICRKYDVVLNANFATLIVGLLVAEGLGKFVCNIDFFDAKFPFF